MATKKKPVKKKNTQRKKAAKKKVAKKKPTKKKVSAMTQRILDNTFGKSKTYNLDQVLSMAKFQHTDSEIASMLDMSANTFRKYIKEDENLKTALELGREHGKAALRQKQFKMAMQGNVPLMLHLGKNYLGQSDKADNTVNLEITQPVINLTIAPQTNPELAKIQEENMKLVMGSHEVVKEKV